MTASLSVVMIAKNSADLLLESLASTNWANEIILLDSGSNDDTVKIAKKAGAKVFVESNNWLGYGIQRQRAQRFATGDYILMIDADEKITPQLRQSIEVILASPKSGVVYSISRRNYFLGYPVHHSNWYPDRVIRLYERNRYQYNDNQVHESLSCKNAKIIRLNGDLLHFACRNFSRFQKKQLYYATVWAKEHFQYRKKTSIVGIFTHTIAAFLRTLLLHGGLLDGKYGWLIAVINAQYTFNKYTELWSLNAKNLNFIKKN